MTYYISRRRFLQATLSTAPAVALAAQPARADAAKSFSFIVLGDLHLDQLEHHDQAWLAKEKPNDVRQVQNYSRITREMTPRLFSTVRETIADLNRTPATRVAFVLQVGDLVEGLCGSPELAIRHNQDALALVRKSQFDVPFLFTKGNHDVTGPGADEAYQQVFFPFLTEQTAQLSTAKQEIKSESYTVEVDDTQFAFFDAYEKDSLPWLEATIAKRTAEHLFVVIHPPVVPYGARATWYLYSGAKDKPRRDKLLELLAQEQACVLGGHIHKFNALARVVDKGRFAQLAVSSVISSSDVQPKDVLAGVNKYDGDQVRVEPQYSPDTEQQRRAVYDSERRFVKSFDYADLPGYAVVHVNGPRVTAQVFSGVSRTLWRTVDLSALLHGAS